jgi:hypothetical protein
MNHHFHSANGKHSAEAILAVAVSGPLSNGPLERIQTAIARLRGISVGEPLTGFTAGLTGVPNDSRESFKVESSPAV